MERFKFCFWIGTPLDIHLFTHLFTRSLAFSFDACVILYCLAEECPFPNRAVSYTGSLNLTMNGLPCEYWSQASVQFEDSSFSDGNPSQAENYCRNPTPETRIHVWCFTKNAPDGWQYCLLCPYNEYKGKEVIRQVIFILTCSFEHCTTFPLSLCFSVRLSVQTIDPSSIHLNYSNDLGSSVIVMPKTM